MDKNLKKILENIKNNQMNSKKLKNEFKKIYQKEQGNNKILAVILSLLILGKCEFSYENFVKENSGCTIIVNGYVFSSNKQYAKQNLLIYKDKILATSEDLPDELPQGINSFNIIDATDMVITPGLIDQHIHGGFGVDFNYASEEDIIEFSQKIVKYGITTYYPTIMTASIDEIKEQIKIINQAKAIVPICSAKIDGINLEGPFLNSKYKGIHPSSSMLKPTVDNYKKIEDPEIKIITYAPELDENFELTKYLANSNVIASAGHTSASSEIIRLAADNGLKQVTHLFNAMLPLHHRNPGVIAEALINDNIFVEVIADGHHLQREIIDLIFKAKDSSKIIFISDSLPLNKADINSVTFGRQKIINKNKEVAVNADNVFAGSMSFLNVILKKNQNNYKHSLLCATKNVCDNLGINNYGEIKRGNIADLAMWKYAKQDKTLHLDFNKPDKVIISGKMLN